MTQAVTSGTRPELLVAVTTAVDVTTQPPTVTARLRAQGRPARAYRFQSGQTAAEATLLVLTDLVRSLDAPTRMLVGLDDPAVARILDREIEPPPWLIGVAQALFEEMIRGSVTIEVAHLDLAD
jgi:hypothetical protein